MPDTTFIVRLDEPGEGPRLAIKDLIDVAGIPTTAGSRAVADRATPAAHDAACLAGARAAGARIVGKANLHELACGATGFNHGSGPPSTHSTLPWCRVVPPPAPPSRWLRARPTSATARTPLTPSASRRRAAA